MTGASSRRLALALALVLVASSVASAAATYDFLTVSGNNVVGNGAMSQFTSPNGLGVINVTHQFSPVGTYSSSGPFIGPGPKDNDNAAIFPSQFQALFPGTGQVQGHLAQTQYGKTLNGTATNSLSTVTFNLINYQVSDTVFGIWNTTNEVAQPPYRVEIVDSNGNLGSPGANFTYVGNQDNETQTGGAQKLNMNLATGNITAGAALPANPKGNTHTDAAFWKIPKGIKQIIVHGNLGVINTNNEGDGVGYYFAELCPKEGNLADLIANHGMLCNGDKKFTDFAYHPIGDMPDASLIDVVSITDSQGNLGIRFIGPFADQPGGGASEALLEYKVTVTDPNKRIKDVHLAANANVLGANGYAAITETFLPEDSNTVLEVFDFQPGPRMLTDWADLTTPVKMLHVQKDVTLFSANARSLATISFIDQSFSQTPEPATALLGAAALIALAASTRAPQRDQST